MKKKIWRSFAKELNVLDDPKNLIHLDKKEINRLIQKDVNLQIVWIMVRSCKGIACKDCYISNECKTKCVGDSQILAGAIVKSTKASKENKTEEKKDADKAAGKE